MDPELYDISTATTYRYTAVDLAFGSYMLQVERSQDSDLSSMEGIIRYPSSSALDIA
jgi:hypothetical protein